MYLLKTCIPKKGLANIQVTMPLINAFVFGRIVDIYLCSIILVQFSHLFALPNKFCIN